YLKGHPQVPFLLPLNNTRTLYVQGPHPTPAVNAGIAVDTQRFRTTPGHSGRAEARAITHRHRPTELLPVRRRRYRAVQGGDFRAAISGRCRPAQPASERGLSGALPDPVKPARP